MTKGILKLNSSSRRWFFLIRFSAVWSCSQIFLWNILEGVHFGWLINIRDTIRDCRCFFCPHLVTIVLAHIYHNILVMAPDLPVLMPLLALKLLSGNGTVSSFIQIWWTHPLYHHILLKWNSRQVKAKWKSCLLRIIMSLVSFQIGLNWNCALESSCCLSFVKKVLVDIDLVKSRHLAMMT